MVFLLQAKNEPQLESARHINPDWRLEYAEQDGHLRAEFSRKKG